jgi:hypothetical protein
MSNESEEKAEEVPKGKECYCVVLVRKDDGKEMVVGKTIVGKKRAKETLEAVRNKRPNDRFKLRRVYP